MRMKAKYDDQVFLLATARNFWIFGLFSDRLVSGLGTVRVSSSYAISLIRIIIAVLTTIF